MQKRYKAIVALVFLIAICGVAVFSQDSYTFTALTGSSLALSGSAPAVTTPGTTPYLNVNTLEKETQNTCTFNISSGTLTLGASPVTVCTFTLPNAALSFAWACQGGYSLPAGTTPTFEPGVAWTQAPSAAFQIAHVYTTNTGTQTSLSTTTTTSTIIINGATEGPAATVFPVEFSGTFTSSATSGTFTPKVSVTGTSATGTFAGSCWIH